jgi:glucan phosphoethanolaminetransferase (alkaline phosphatase superfamily)
MFGLEFVPEAESRNLIIIMLDTVRGKSLAAYGYNHVTTPHNNAKKTIIAAPVSKGIFYCRNMVMTVYWI